MSETASDPIRVCLLADGWQVTEWQRRALEHLFAETDARLTTVVNNTVERDRSRLDLLERAVELREWTVAAALLKLSGEASPWTRSVALDCPPFVADADRIDCEPETVEGWKRRLPASAEERVTDRADVAVRFGFGFLVGDLLTDLDHGVLSYHHGDIREYRGQPAGCWEYIHGRESVGITLQRITETLDAGEVVAETSIPIDDAHTYGEVRDRLYGHSTDLLTEGVRTLRSPDDEPVTVDSLGDRYTFPRGTDALRFVAKELRGTLRASRAR